MSQRKKPAGYVWDSFVARWYESGHDGKLTLAQEYGVSYETAKHWISDSGSTRKQVKCEQRMTMTVPEVLAMRPSVSLDFVSFDIETSNLRADFSVMLTACIKPFNQEPTVFRADNYPEWKTQRHNDSGIVKDIANELRKHAVVITHYGSRGKFDLPFLMAKMVKHRLEPLPPMFGFDSWRVAKSSFAVSSRRLKNLAYFFDLGEKEGVEGDLWMSAAYDGDREAMDEIVKHNVQDVALLERLACIVFPYLRSIPRL